MASFTTATESQIRFANSLITERGLTLDKAVMLAFNTADVEGFEIDKRRCSTMIDALKSVRRPERERPAAPELDAGMYKIGPDIYRVKISKSSGKPYAEILRHDMIINGDTDVAVWFDYAPGAVRKITPQHRMTLDQCAEFGLEFGTCCVCARTLTKPASIAKGIGPVCEKKI